MPSMICLFPSLVDNKFIPARWQTVLIIDVEEQEDDVAHGLDANCMVSQNGSG